MTNFEMVEVLREKANVSYEEARQALENSNWDLLEAMLLLEKEGKVSQESCTYSTRTETAAEEETAGHRGPDGLRSAVRWLGKTIRKLILIGNKNSLVVSHKDKEAFSLPVTVCAILLLCSVWTMLIAMGISLFFGVRYEFRGPNLGKEKINSAMNRAATAAENIKEEIRQEGESK